MVRGIREVEASFGSSEKAPTLAEIQMAKIVRRSLVAARFIPAGKRLVAEDIAIMRPGTGLPPDMHDQMLGKIASADLPEGSLLSADNVE